MAENKKKRTGLIIAASIAGVALIAIIGGIVWFFSGDAPAEVSLESAVEDVEDATGTSTTDAGSADGGTGPSDGIEGSWTVDASIGEFSFEDATSTFVGFRIAEELASIGTTEAVGRTPTVEGTLVIEGTTLVEAEIVADMTDIVTETSRRDDRVQDALSTTEFPTATFTLTQPIEIGSDLGDGDQFSATGVGDLTIAGVTQPIEIPLAAEVVGDVVVVVGSVDITFADWDVQVPTSPAVLSVEDHGPLEMQLFFIRG